MKEEELSKRALLLAIAPGIPFILIAYGLFLLCERLGWIKEAGGNE